ncbi:hypothetical protein AB0N14_06565 [Streptomyces sp. NPDC051104]|uniref:hypothetical protein n=1 Tax=Streptomyces sp. NPDC051104 TaxID=3155044 RepID=UPI00343E39E4
MTIDDEWKSKYDALAVEFLKRHFGYPPNLAFLRPKKTPNYAWKKKKKDKPKVIPGYMSKITMNTMGLNGTHGSIMQLVNTPKHTNSS